jgi:hypothetical protein
MSAYHGWLTSGTRVTNRRVAAREARPDTVSPNHYPHSQRVECPPNTRMSSQTSQSSSTTYVHIGPPISPYNIQSLSVCSLRFSLGLGNNQSWIRRPGSSKMFFPLIVRPALASSLIRVCGGEGRVGLTLFFFLSFFPILQCRAAEAHSGHGGCS